MIRALLALILPLAIVPAVSAAAQSYPGASVTGETVQDPPTRGFGKGQFLPDIELPRIDGTGTLRLSDFAASLGGIDGDDKPGKKLLVINFASW